MKTLLIEVNGDKHGVFDIDVAVVHIDKRTAERILEVSRVRAETVGALAKARACYDSPAYETERSFIDSPLGALVWHDV